MTSFLRCLVVFALPGALFAQSSATTAPATQPASFADGGKQWALEVSNRQLIAAMPEGVQSICIHRFDPEVRKNEKLPFDQVSPDSIEGVDGIRTLARVMGGSDFKGMPFSFGNFNFRSITITLDSLEPVQRIFDTGFAHDAEVRRENVNGEPIHVKRYLAIPARTGRPEVWKTEYCAFLNQYCLVTAENEGELISILRSLRREKPELRAEWSSLLPEDDMRAKTLILRQLRADRDPPQLHLIGVGNARADGFCYTVSSYSPLQFRFNVNTEAAVEDSGIYRQYLGRPELGLEIRTVVAPGGFVLEAEGPADCYFAQSLYLYELLLFGRPVHGL